MNSKVLRQQQLQNWINQYTDFTCDELHIVSGDASFRRYFRFLSKDTWIVAVDAPPELENSANFINVAKRYNEEGIKVPEVFAYDLALGFYCQQDFGDHQFSQALNEHSSQILYPKALANIPKIQKCVATENGKLPLYDEIFVHRELTMFNEWLVEK